MKAALLFYVFLIPGVFMGTHAQDFQGLDEIAPFSEGLAGIRKGNEWGFINEQGELVIAFRSDLPWKGEDRQAGIPPMNSSYPQFKNGLCLISKTLEEEGIPVYGFMDTSGQVVIQPEYLNITPFEGEYATGILLTKTFRGENPYGLRIYDYKFSEVVINRQGEIQFLVTQRSNIQMDKRRYKIPAIHSRILSASLLAVRSPDGTWGMRGLNP